MNCKQQKAEGRYVQPRTNVGQRCPACLQSSFIAGLSSSSSTTLSIAPSRQPTDKRGGGRGREGGTAFTTTRSFRKGAVPAVEQRRLFLQHHQWERASRQRTLGLAERSCVRFDSSEMSKPTALAQYFLSLLFPVYILSLRYYLHKK